MRIKKTFNILFLLLFAFFITSCFQVTGPQESGAYILPQGNYGGCIYACEKKEYEFFGGRMGFTYKKSEYNSIEEEDITITINYGFIIDELFNILDDYNVEKFTYQIEVYSFFERKRIDLLNLLKKEEIFIENEEVLNKYKCTKEVLEYQKPMGYYNGAIYKYSYTPHGTIEYKIKTKTIMDLFELYRSLPNTIHLELVFDIVIDENTKINICNIFIRFGEYNNLISISDSKYD